MNVVAFVLILVSIIPVWLAQRLAGAETTGAPALASQSRGACALRSDDGGDLRSRRRRDASLVAERDRLLAELGEPIEAPGQMTYGSQAAAASHVFEQQRDLALRDRSRDRAQPGRDGAATARRRDVRDVHRAAATRSRPERLEAIPWTPLCIDCARKGVR